MPIFDTPEPISATIDLGVGDVRISASDRTDTVVEVRPSDQTDESDVKAAKQVRVEYVNGELLVTGPRPRFFDPSRKTRSVDVTIELPSGSRVHGDAAIGQFHGTGLLGECRFEMSAGHVRLDGTGPLRVDTGAGYVVVDRVAGNAEVSTGSGRVTIGEVDGTGVVKNSNGRTEIGAATGEVRVRAANGDISVDRASAGVDAKCANGSIFVGEVIRGALVLNTSTGDLEVGVADGIDAWLDLDTGYGRVRNALSGTSPQPGGDGETVEVRAHTSFGDITVRRA
ncbi:DUF4097 family beta strand repeat-containing protein [Amycolatopsis nigrescens]|uniref:DUF4097 family beta strand repeat-containing protein n=1 Tax=Amycolatopsis nigrescens TaxID=381445 RepID=UPI000369015D|nr:DUF4097 family beta strand repeat-containing protein [Amycolatopsis nigrescens]